jgi:hypothetical protein
MDSKRPIDLNDADVEAMLRKYRVLGPNAQWAPLTRKAPARRWMILAASLLLIIATARVISGRIADTFAEPEAQEDRLTKAIGARTPSEVTLAQFVAMTDTCDRCGRMEIAPESLP